MHFFSFPLILCGVFLFSVVSATEYDPSIIPSKVTGDAFTATELNTLVNVVKGLKRDDQNTSTLSDDRFGIGLESASPTQKLEVNGGIKATRFIGDGSQLTSLPEKYWIQIGGDINYPLGNVGIGTSSISPGLKLDIAGKVGAVEYCDALGTNCVMPSDIASSIGSGGGASSIQRGGSNPGSGSEGDIFYNTSNNQIYFHDGSSWVEISNSVTVTTPPGSPDAGDTYYNTSSNEYFYYDGDSWEVLGGGKWEEGTTLGTIYYTGGNVGIGTSNPSFKLTIVGDATASWVSAAALLADTSAGGRAYSIGSRNGVGFHIGDETAGVSLLVIDAAGNAGIGTNSPSSGLKLDIEGKIGATEYCDQNGGNCVPAGSLSSGGSDNLGDHTATQTLDTQGIDFSRDSAQGHIDVDGALYRTNGQAYITVDDNLYIRDANGDSSFRFITGNNPEIRMGTSTNNGWNTIAMDSANSTKTLKIHGMGDSNHQLRFGRYGDNYQGWEANPVVFDMDADHNTFFVAGNSRVGIGTSSPAQKLHVNGNIRADGRHLYLGSAQDIYGDNSSAVYYDSNHDTVTQLIMRDKQNTVYGRLYGDGDGVGFGLLDGDGNWAIRHSKDNYTEFRDNNEAQFRVGAGGVSGSYGTVETQGGGKAGWEGFNINGRYVFMSSDNNTVGIYDDINNRWREYWDADDYDLRHQNNELIMHADEDAYTYLYHNGGWKLRTESTGVRINNDLWVNRICNTSGGDCKNQSSLGSGSGGGGGGGATGCIYQGTYRAEGYVFYDNYGSCNVGCTNYGNGSTCSNYTRNGSRSCRRNTCQSNGTWAQTNTSCGCSCTGRSCSDDDDDNDEALDDLILSKGAEGIKTLIEEQKAKGKLY